MDDWFSFLLGFFVTTAVLHMNCHRCQKAAAGLLRGA